MIDVEEFDGGFRVVDAAKNEVEIEIDGWEPGGEELEIGYDVVETRSGRGTAIRLPEAGFLLRSSELEHPEILNMNDEIRLKAGDNLCRLDTWIKVFIQIDASSAVTATKTRNSVNLSFASPTRFTFGFKEFDNFPCETIRVPPTLDGAAAALETCASMHVTETPDRSFPSERPIPPNFEIDKNAVVDNSEANERRNPIHFRIPPFFKFLIPLAPLAYYVGAGVTVEPRDGPVLELESVVHELPSDSQFSDEVAALLRRVFYLDCLVREAGPRRLSINEFNLLDEVAVDPKQLYESPMQDRINEYLDIPFESIDSGLPDWPLGTYVEPTVENLSIIPFLIDRLSMVFPPRSVPLDRRTWVKRSLGDFHRSGSSKTAANSPIKVVSPEAHQTRVQGWIAPGNPIDAFKCPPEAFGNQRDYLVSSSEPISLRVVLNDDAMHVEHSQVIQIYQERAENLSVELDVSEQITREELARVFESPCDFIHYIGHYDPSGFRCDDGNLSVEEISQSRARTFFLNACGSYTAGLDLVRKGSVAGAVTFGDIIDAQAAKVGVDFARLYMYGYTIERALSHARGRAIMNRQYSIVGDGTHVLTQGDTIQPAITHVTETSTGKFSVRLDAAPVNLNGGVTLAYADTVPNLMGNHEGATVDQIEFGELLRGMSEPVIFDGKFYWPEELLEELF